MTKLSHIELYVSDYKKSIRFYDLILGALSWTRLVCHSTHTTYTDGEMKIVLCPVEEKYRGLAFHRKRVGLNHFAFYASSKDEVDRIYNQIIKPSSIACLYDKTPSGDDSYYALFFEDPDRIKIEIVYAPGYCEAGLPTNLIQSDFDPYSSD